jgi:hypothetical protein
MPTRDGGGSYNYPDADPFWTYSKPIPGGTPSGYGTADPANTTGRLGADGRPLGTGGQPGGGGSSLMIVTEAQIRQLFKDWLGREPSAQDIANAAGQTFEAVKSGVVNSTEHKNRWTGQVSAWYRDLLGREPSAAEVNSHYTADNLNDIQRVLKTLQDSPEYKARVAAGAVPSASPSSTSSHASPPGIPRRQPATRSWWPTPTSRHSGSRATARATSSRQKTSEPSRRTRSST